MQALSTAFRRLAGLWRGVCLAFAPAGLALLLAAACQTQSRPESVQPDAPAASFQRGAGQFTFSEWAGPPITVWTYAPEGEDLSRLPIVVVMHGVGRDGDRYRDDWIETAKAQKLIVLAPTFSADAFPKAAGYNLGNVLDEKTGGRNDEAVWSFSAIDPLFQDAVRRIGGKQTSYALYGHSAGAQFVHRYLYYKPDSLAGLFVVANAGWYTMPDFKVTYPYGLAGSTLEPQQLDRALGRNVLVLLGDSDTDEIDPNLRRTPEAMAQGPHRFARGQSFFAAASKAASERGVPFGWRTLNVPGANHSDALMAPSAAALIRDWDASR